MGAAVEEDIPVWDRLSYDKDAVIEASAGTGKTYTLERIVLKLVLEKGIPLKKILLVTFTEKAAGELRDRIRGAFEKEAVAAGDAEGEPAALRRKRIDEALRCFDRASISTIHSFCQRLLREYAFENGIPMATQVISSTNELAARAVREVILSDAFQRSVGPDFAASMAIATDDASMEKFVDGMATALSGYRSDRWDFYPESREPGGDTPPVADSAAGLRDAMGGKSLVDWLLAGREPLSPGLEKLKAAAGRLEPLLADLLRPGDPRFVTALRAYGKLKFGRNDFNPKLKKSSGGGSAYDGHPELPAFLASLAEEPARIRCSNLHRLFEKARERFQEIREQEACLSYDDMVLRARDALSGPCGEVLLEKLRAAYRVALVDEFQDTDGIQWDIFRTVFSCTPENPDHFLIVVGDPKQAIYGFRGADLQTYLDARGIIRSSGEIDTLSTSYRSRRPLLEAFNRLFGTGGWFDPAEATNGITYEEVRYPPGNIRFKDDGPGTFLAEEPGPVALLESMPPFVEEEESKGFGNKAVCLPVFAENAAREIERLCPGGKGTCDIFDEKAEKNRRPLRYSDFAFLVRSKADADPVKKALRLHGIPYSHYKEAGVYGSAEGEAVLALLELVADVHRPGKRAAALLTPFFGVPVDELETTAVGNVPSFTRLLYKWTRLARERRWALLFESFIEDTRLWCPAGEGDSLYDRRLGTTRQILDDLLTSFGTTAQSPADFADGLRLLKRQERDTGDENGMRQKETEADHVQIMTMHAAKGLEFPVVFIAYGFSLLFPTKDYKVLSYDAALASLDPKAEDVEAGKERRRVFHADGSPFRKKTDEEIYNAGKARDEAEIRRLLYVALTRARYKLYLPWSARAGEGGIGSKGSPLRGGFLCQALLGLYPEGFEGKVLDYSGKAVEVEAGVSSGGHAADEQGPVCLPDLPPGLRSRRVHWDSFSSIHHAAVDAGPVAPGPEKQQALDGPEKEADEPVSVAGGNEAVSAPRPTLLPRGTASGTVFHELMEELCDGDGSEDRPGFEIGKFSAGELFAEGKGAVVLALAGRLLRVHGLADREDEVSGDTTAKTLVRMAWNALRAPIAIGTTTFRLADLPPADRRAEVSFVVDQQAILGKGPGRNGLFNGSIDLLFRLPGTNRYFILDWKTNSLPSYGAEDVSAAMDAANYHLQYQLYTLAASAWLGAGRLAGSAYLFVRGGEQGQDGPGIFARPYNEAVDGDGYREDVSRNLSAARGGEENR